MIALLFRLWALKKLWQLVRSQSARRTQQPDRYQPSR
jgi:hypothetical protein